jgi:DNA-binding Lrp family transcriptional regulator
MAWARHTKCETDLKVCDMVTAEQRQTNRKIAEKLEISFGSCQTMLTEYLGMRCVSKWLLRVEQKELKLSVASDLFDVWK